VYFFLSTHTVHLYQCISSVASSVIFYSCVRKGYEKVYFSYARTLSTLPLPLSHAGKLEPTMCIEMVHTLCDKMSTSLGQAIGILYSYHQARVKKINSKKKNKILKEHKHEIHQYLTDTNAKQKLHKNKKTQQIARQIEAPRDEDDDDQHDTHTTPRKYNYPPASGRGRGGKAGRVNGGRGGTAGRGNGGTGRGGGQGGKNRRKDDGKQEIKDESSEEEEDIDETIDLDDEAEKAEQEENDRMNKAMVARGVTAKRTKDRTQKQHKETRFITSENEKEEEEDEGDPDVEEEDDDEDDEAEETTASTYKV
jgi:hypothetical protein